MAVLDRFLAPDSGFQERFFFLAKRFVPGETSAAALEAVSGLNDLGMSATLDFLGEDVTDRAEAERYRDAYLDLIEVVRARGARTNFSLKLTALGLLVNEDLALENLRMILERTASTSGGALLDSFVRIDMEGSSLVEPTLRIFERAFATHKNVGPVLQAYLHRTRDDVERAIALGARVRLCKGAYNEPPTLAYKSMETIRAHYLRDAEALLSRGTYPGIATHDERVIRAVKMFVAERGIARDAFEFQMLYGVRPDLQRQLVAEGYRMRVYIPYGTHWAGYFYRRITERKENALLALRAALSR